MTMIQQLTTKNLNRASTSADVPVYPITTADAVKVTTEEGEKNLTEIIEETAKKNSDLVIITLMPSSPTNKTLDDMSIANYDEEIYTKLILGYPYIFTNIGLLTNSTPTTEIIDMGAVEITLTDVTSLPADATFFIHDIDGNDCMLRLSNNKAYIEEYPSNLRVLGINNEKIPYLKRQSH